MPDFQFKMDKSHIEFVNEFDNKSDKNFWKTKTPEERLQALEFLRQQSYDKNASSRLQRVIEFTERKKS
jgi:hypothetical protein